ncbi:hypothetical protein GCM10009550_53530 [Actinocorallia libanotica]|uniref:DNA-binding protein n=2 Tax=Actinocorallia libanotica TaxID=46162 RepID=A0ABP4C7L8_9ACTN
MTKRDVFSLGMGLFKGKKAKGPQRYNLPHGQMLTCLVCRGQFFDRRRYKLNTTGMEFLDLAWANEDATCLVCVNCRHIHWFAF